MDHAPSISVERPFDLESPGSPLPPLPLQHTASTGQIFEPETPLAYPEDATLPPLTSAPPHDQDEPSDFEWRNLKKLTVLVLSSLMWKNKLVQDHVGKDEGLEDEGPSGLETLLACCQPDEHNPYIREHAVMCLRFAIEGNEANVKKLKSLASEENGGETLRDARTGMLIYSTKYGDVPREVLDTNSYETFVDAKGQVGLRRRETAISKAAQRLSSSAAAAAQAIGSNNAMSTSAPAPGSSEDFRLLASSAASTTNGQLAPEDRNAAVVGGAPRDVNAEVTAQHMMHDALRNLPIGERLLSANRAEAVATLDRAFESTERALGEGSASGTWEKWSIDWGPAENWQQRGE